MTLNLTSDTCEAHISLNLLEDGQVVQTTIIVRKIFLGKLKGLLKVQDDHKTSDI